jgi:tetratricopeptide (TPR) repeat protein
VVTGYKAELVRLDAEIARASGAAALDPPTDAERVTRYVYALYQRASLSGDPAGLAAAEHAIARGITLLAHPGDLYFLKANVALKLHRLDDADAALDAVPNSADNAEARLIRADLDFQRGRYGAAETSYRAVAAEKSWGALARLAHFIGKMGDADGADRLYQEAQDELTAKELRAFAWLEVQRGFLDFCRGRFAEAQSHYRRADAAYPGYWLVGEHIAELSAAEGRFDAAIAMLERLAAAVARPDLDQAIGELYRLAGRSAGAAPWLGKAFAAYRQSAERGEVHYWHHLADYYAEVEGNGTAAVVWARRDVQLRPHFSTQAALASALHRAGCFAEARQWIDRALSSGVADARLFNEAAAICRAAGDRDAGRIFEERANRLNPFVGRFHLHH